MLMSFYRRKYKRALLCALYGVVKTGSQPYERGLANEMRALRTVLLTRFCS